MITPIIHHSLSSPGLGLGERQSTGPHWIEFKPNTGRSHTAPPRPCPGVFRTSLFLLTLLQPLLGIPREGHLPPRTLAVGRNTMKVKKHGPQGTHPPVPREHGSNVHSLDKTL